MSGARMMLIVALLWPLLAWPQQGGTVMQQMEALRQQHGVYFIYDASLNLDLPYTGKSLRGRRLDKSLQRLFERTDVRYRRHGRNIMLWREERPVVQSAVRASQQTTARLGRFSLKEPRELPNVTVTGRPGSPMLTTQTGRRTLTAGDIHTEFALLSSPDLIKKLQQISGVAEGLELTSGLLVHGGNSDENLFLLDGTPLYQTNHSLGLFSAFNTDVIDHVDFYKSDFPARYIGRVSSVTDVSTRDGNLQRFKGLFSIGLIDGRLQLEGPIVKNRTSFNFALRRSWADLLMAPVMWAINKQNSDGEEFNLGYAFYDLNAKVTHRLRNDGRLWLAIYNGRDRYKVHDGDNMNPSTDSDTRLQWGNFNVTLGAQTRLWKGASATFAAIGTCSHSVYDTDEEDCELQHDGSWQRLSLNQCRNHTRLYDVGAKADLQWKPASGHNLRFGGSYTHHIFRPQTIVKSIYNQNLAMDTTAMNQRVSALSDEMSLYAEDEMYLTPRLLAHVGGSYTLAAVKGRVYHMLDPRLAVKYQLTDWCSAKVSYTLMSQSIHRLASTFLEIPGDFWVPVNAGIHPTQSGQVAGGLYAHRGPWIVTIEGYYKASDHLLMYKDWFGLQPPATRWEQNVTQGRGRSYGMELDVACEASRLSASLAYTLSWNRRRFPELCDHWFRDQFDNRHRLTLSARYRFNRRVAMHATWTMHSGNHATLPSGVAVYPTLPGDKWDSETGYIYTDPNNFTLPAYHRLDVGADFRRITKRGRTRIWNLSLYNAYCHFNTMYVKLKQNPDGTFRAKSGGYIPIIPSASYTIQF